MQYTEEFKRGVVRMLLASGMTRREFAAKTKITLMTLRKWVKQYKDEEIEKVDDNNRKKYSEEYKKRIVTQMLFDGITYKTMAKKTGISPQVLEYWDNKYRYIIIADHEKIINRRRKKVRKGATWHRYGAGAGRYE
jgi:transposase-like protein